MEFLGAKWVIFGPKMSQKCPKLFLKIDEVCQVSSILDIEKKEKFHHFLILEVVNEAQQVLNFLTSREFQPTNFLKKFLHLVQFEPQFSYK